MTYLPHRHNVAAKNRMIGIEIFNDSLDAHTLSFLGNDHQKPPEGVEYRNAFGETVYDDGNGLAELRNWIRSVGRVLISTIRIQSSSMYYLSAKRFSVGTEDENENKVSASWNLASFLNYGHAIGVITIPNYKHTLDCKTFFELTEVQPLESIIITLHLADEENQYKNIQYKSTIEDLEHKISKENKRKLLLLM